MSEPDLHQRLRPRAERRRLLVGVLGGLAATVAGPVALRALARAHQRETATRAGLAFGTTVSLTLVGADGAELEPAFREAFRAIRAVEAAASLYRADSALARLNRDGYLPDPDPLLVEQLRFALGRPAASGGAYDPPDQPLWTLWAQAAARGARPEGPALAATLARVGWQSIEVGDRAIRLARPGMGVTLNGLVQGYAADRVITVLRQHGITDAFVDTGEFGALGRHADGTPWRLGIGGAHRGELAAVIEPFTGFAATSGDDATVFSPDRRDHHIFDPATGFSPGALSAVTVTAPSGLLADALSTAAFVLGPVEGAALVARYPGCAARFTAKL